MFVGVLLTISQGPGQLCLIRHPALRKLTLGQINTVRNKGQVFKIEREVDFINYIIAVKAAYLP